jgi:hypothetical protein
VRRTILFLLKPSARMPAYLTECGLWWLWMQVGQVRL